VNHGFVCDEESGHLKLKNKGVEVLWGNLPETWFSS